MSQTELSVCTEYNRHSIQYTERAVLVTCAKKLGRVIYLTKSGIRYLAISPVLHGCCQAG